MTFQAPLFLWLLCLLPVFIVLYRYFQKRRKQETLLFSDISTLKFIGAGVKPWKKYLSFTLELLLLLMLVGALSKPQTLFFAPSNSLVLALCFDTSGSMTANDFFPSRIEAAKQAARGFVENQSISFPIGVLTFSDTAAVRLEPIDTREDVLAAINDVDAHLGGTAIGDAIFASMNLLSGFKESNKVILLLSDGENNRGSDPLIAAKVAQNNGIKIYTVGVGTPEGTYIPGIPEKVRLDEKTLETIAQTTGGEYHRVTDTNDLKKIFIQLSRTIKIVKKYGDATWLFVSSALLLLCIKLFLDFTLLRRIP